MSEECYDSFNHHSLLQWCGRDLGLNIPVSTLTLHYEGLIIMLIISKVFNKTPCINIETGYHFVKLTVYSENVYSRFSNWKFNSNRNKINRSASMRAHCQLASSLSIWLLLYIYTFFKKILPYNFHRNFLLDTLTFDKMCLGQILFCAISLDNFFLDTFTFDQIPFDETSWHETLTIHFVCWDLKILLKLK